MKPETAVLFFIAVFVLSAQPAAQLFDDQSVQEVWLDVDPAEWKTLRDNYLLDTYYPANFQWNGIGLNRIGIRSRGSGSRSPHKPNLLLSFDRYTAGQKVLGLPSVILKANNQDASLLHELVAMKLFRRMGLPAPLEAPARVYVNGEFFGAYTLVEVVDEAFLRRNYGEDTGYLYDWQEDRTNGYRFEYLGPDPASYSPRFWDPKTHKADPDAAPIEAMVRTINFAPDSEFEAEVARFLSPRQFLTHIAIESFLADYDGVMGTVFGMNNFYMYRFDGTVLSQFLPWDKDASFDWEKRPIYAGLAENILGRRVLQSPALRAAYLDALMEVADSAGGPGGWMEQEINRLYYLVRELALEDPNKQCTTEGLIHSCGGEDFERAVEHMRQFTRERAGFVTSVVLSDAGGLRPASEERREAVAPAR